MSWISEGLVSSYSFSEKKKKKKKVNCKPCFVLNSLFVWSGWGECGHTCEDRKLSVHKSGVRGEVGYLCLPRHDQMKETIQPPN